MSYASTDQLRGYLKQIPADVAPSTTNDDLLQAVLDRSTSMVNDALGFAGVGGAFATWATAATTRDVRGEGGEWLYPPSYQPDSVDTVSEVYSKGLTSETTHAVTDWAEEEASQAPGGRLYRSGGWGDRAWYRIGAIWGYGPAPNSIVEVTLELAVNLWRAKDAGRFSNVVGVEGGGAVGYEKALTPQQQMVVLNVARRFGFGGIW